MTSPVNLVETTLRDGSYEIDFQWTAADTAFLVSALERAGVTYIEIAHGSGIGSAEWRNDYRPSPRPAATDHEHMIAACAAAERAQIGVLYCAGTDMTPPDRLADLAKIGIKFVRLAYFPSNIGGEFELSYIERARDEGLLVSVNLMKTYAMTPDEVSRAAEQCAKRGAEWFYVVDSAGGMSAAEVAAHVKAVAKTGLRVGLHAHNNLGLAHANSLAAVEAGATLCDGTLQGLGRATGNAPTEQLLLALQRMGHEREVDYDAILRLGRTVRRLLEAKGQNPDFFASGAARLHSRSAKRLFQVAKEQKLSASEVLLAVGNAAHAENLLGKEVFAEEFITRALGAVRKERTFTVAASAVKNAATELEQARSGLPAVVDALYARAHKSHLTGVLQLVSPEYFPHDGPAFWFGNDQVGATLAVGTQTMLGKAADDRLPDVLVLDEELVGRTDLPASTRKLVLSFRALVADATAELIAQLGASRDQVSLPEADRALTARVELGLEARAVKAAGGAGGRVVVRIAKDLVRTELEQLAKNDTLVVVGTRPDLRSFVDVVRARGARALHPPVWPAVAAAVSLGLAVRSRLARSLDGVALTPRLHAVDTFVCEASGEAVVDSVETPMFVVTPADPASFSEIALARTTLLASGIGEI